MFVRPTRLQELFIRDYLFRNKGLNGNIIVHSLWETEHKCIVNIEINRYDYTQRDPKIVYARLMRVVL